MKAADKAKAFVLREYPTASAAGDLLGINDSWIYIKKDKGMLLGGYSIIGYGRTEDNAWKSAARRVMKDNG